MYKVVNGIRIPLSQAEIMEAEQRQAAHQAKLAELALTEYKRKREAEYPSIQDLVVALVEKIGENRPEDFNTLMSQRMAVKAKYPKKDEEEEEGEAA